MHSERYKQVHKPFYRKRTNLRLGHKAYLLVYIEEKVRSFLPFYVISTFLLPFSNWGFFGTITTPYKQHKRNISATLLRHNYNISSYTITEKIHMFNIFSTVNFCAIVDIPKRKEVQIARDRAKEKRYRIKDIHKRYPRCSSFVRNRKESLHISNRNYHIRNV